MGIERIDMYVIICDLCRMAMKLGRYESCIFTPKILKEMAFLEGWKQDKKDEDKWYCPSCKPKSEVK